MEKVVISKLSDFSNHDLLQILSSFYELKKGSSNFYEKVFHKLIERRKDLRPVEFVKLFTILPNIHYIYDNNMSEELWNDYLGCVSNQIYKKTLPIEHLVTVFNTYVQINFVKGHSKLFYNMINQIRGAIYQIPAEQFSNTMLHLVEAQIIDVAMKFIPIVEKVKENGQLLDVFKTPEDRIRLLWSLVVLEKAENLLSREDINHMLNDIDVKQLDSMHFKLLMQVLNLSLPVESIASAIDYESFYTQLSQISDEFRQEVVNNDLSSRTSDELRLKIREELESMLISKPEPASKPRRHRRGKFNPNKSRNLGSSSVAPKWEVHNNFIDDFLN